MYNVLQKISCIETIEVIKITNITKIWFSMKLYHYKAGYPEKLGLETILPLEFDNLGEVRGFLKGVEAILGAELYVTKIESLVFRLDRWTKIGRDHIKVCFQDGHALTPRNLPHDIFVAKTGLEFIELDSSV